MPGQTFVVPKIVPNVSGDPESTETTSVEARLVPQVPLAVTLISPFCPDVPALTVSDKVP